MGQETLDILRAREAPLLESVEGLAHPVGRVVRQVLVLDGVLEDLVQYYENIPHRPGLQAAISAQPSYERLHHRPSNRE